MEKEFFEELESFMKNLSGFIPTDDTVLNLLKLEGEVHNLKDKVEKLYAILGKQAEQLYGLEHLGATGEQLKSAKEELAKKEKILASLKEKLEGKYKGNTTYTEEEFSKQTKETDTQEDSEKIFCTSCGKKITPGDKFCAKCGAKLN